jgi:monothiol glutaredoxin
MADDVQAKIKSMVDGNRVLLFMKGDREFPQCGFSMRAVQVVKALGVPFETVNVLADPAVREGVKTFSSWPTIPQLYVDGQFIGGSDIVYEMYQSGELQKLVDAHPKVD